MAPTYTTFLGLTKPAITDPALIADLNTNADVVDAAHGPVYSVRKYGAVGDGTTDDGVAIRAAMTAATATGGVVEFPGGPGTVYALGASGGTYSLTLASNVAIRGSGATIRRAAGNTQTLLGATTALADVRISDLTIDSQDSSAARCLYVPNGSSRIALDRVRFTRLAVAIAVEFAAGAAQHTDVRIADCVFDRTLADTGAGENLAIVGVYDASHVRVERCRFDTVGALHLKAVTAAACPSTNPMHDVALVGCSFERIKTTCVFLEPNPSCFMANLRAEGNSFLNIGKTIEKGAFTVGAAVGAVSGVVIRGNTIRDWGYSGSSGGAVAANAAQAIILSGCVGAVVEGNTLDARTLAGAAPTANIGITVVGTTDLAIRGNTVQYCGWGGIRVAGATGATVERFVIEGNTVFRCATAYDASEVPSGIYVKDYASNGTISGNVCINNGAGAATQAAGIGIATGTSATTIQDILVADNVCFDTNAGGGGKFQQYGIRVGYTGSSASAQPTRIALVGNQVGGVDVAGGNAVAGLFYQTTVNLGYTVGVNPGADRWIDYAPTWTGFSANPTVTSRYKVVGRVVTWKVILGAAGTSNATTLTATLPVPARESQPVVGFGRGADNGVALTVPVRIDLNSTTVAGFFKDVTGAAWTNTGSKYVEFEITYEASD